MACTGTPVDPDDFGEGQESVSDSPPRGRFIAPGDEAARLLLVELTSSGVAGDSSSSESDRFLSLGAGSYLLLRFQTRLVFKLRSSPTSEDGPLGGLP